MYKDLTVLWPARGGDELGHTHTHTTGSHGFKTSEGVRNKYLSLEEAERAQK